MDSSPTPHRPNNCVVNWFHAYHCTVTPVALLLNILLYYFIKKWSPMGMSDYTKILYMSCFLDIFSTCMHLLIMTRPTVENDILVHNLDGPLPRFLDSLGVFGGGRLHLVALLEHVPSYFSFVFSLIPYTYRYFNLVWNVKFSWPRLLLLSLVLYLPAMIPVVLMVVFGAFTYDIMRELVYPLDSRCMRNFPIFDMRVASVEPYSTLMVNRTIYLYLLAPVMMVYFITRIYFFLRHSSAITSYAKKAEKFIGRTLITQSLVPLFASGVPMLFFFYAIITDSMKDVAFQATFLVMALLPVINPLVTIFILQNYRHALKYVIFCQPKAKQDVMLSSTGPQFAQPGWTSSPTLTSIKC